MKIITLFSLPFIYVITALAGGQTAQQKVAGPVYELTDLKGIKFAGNLKDWRGDPVDSLQLDMYYPTGATSDKKYPLLYFAMPAVLQAVTDLMLWPSATDLRIPVLLR